MRLVVKVVGALAIGMMAVLAVHGVLTFRREKSLLQTDMKRDGYLLAHAMGEAMLRVWAQEGRQKAIEFIKAVDAQDKDVHLSWVSFDEAAQRDLLTAKRLDKLEERGVATAIETNGSDPGNLHTYLKISGPRGERGGIHIVESLDGLTQYVHTSAIRLSIAILVVLIVCVLLALWIGHQWVGKPISNLIEKTHRVSRGDFASHVEHLPKDEFGTLGSALNGMSDALLEARNRREEEYLKRLTTEAQLRHAQRLTTVGTLASGVAHEIGTPLNVISAHAKMIARRQIVSDEAVESGNTIVDQTEHITTIVKQLLGFARCRASRTESIDVARLVKESVALLRPLTKKGNVTVTANELNRPLEVVGDAAQLQQVIANLVTNGIHAMPEGGNLTISVSTQKADPPAGVDGRDAEYVCVSVEDQGRGISESDLNRIFDPFFTTKQVGEGTGLGLSVAHGIVAEHHGWIHVHSEVGKGTCFSVFLPQSTES